MAATRYFTGPIGTLTILPNGQPSTRSYADSGYEQKFIDNTAGDHSTPNSFLMNRTRVTGGIVSGRYMYSPGFGEGYNNYPSRVYDHSRTAPPSFSLPGDLASKLFAQANPLRPEILLPVFLFELRELPGMIRQLGRFNLLKPSNRPGRGDSRLPAQMWLSGNFGWAPLVSDLSKLMGFSESLAKREQEFDRIFAKGGTTRKMTLYTNSSPAQTSFTVSAGNVNRSLTATGMSSVKTWGTVRVKPSVLPSGNPIRRPPPDYVARAFLGLTANNISSNVWEALPWSWLIDYFINVGSYLQSHSTGRMFTLDGACIMTHQVRTVESKPFEGAPDKDGNTIKISGAKIVSESKSRDVVYNTPLPSIRMSPLSGHQLSILGSLAVSRWKP